MLKQKTNKNGSFAALVSISVLLLLVILLENNTPWVADGLRSLGSSVDRKAFQSLLVEMLQENNINFVHVQEPDYDGRFLRCVELVKELMGEQR